MPCVSIERRCGVMAELSCYDCIHCDVCSSIGSGSYHCSNVSNCKHFNNKADYADVKHGYWINTPPYRAANGNYNKAQECSVCGAFFVSKGNEPYSDHPYCCRCGAKMDGPPQKERS